MSAFRVRKEMLCLFVTEDRNEMQQDDRWDENPRIELCYRIFQCGETVGGIVPKVVLCEMH